MACVIPYLAILEADVILLQRLIIGEESKLGQRKAACKVVLLELAVL